MSLHVAPELEPAALRRRRWLPKVVGYAGVSAIATTLTISVLGALVYTGTLTPGWANVVATAAGTIPSFELNRRWVWGKRGRRSPAEVVPFWSLSFLGLALSTFAVSLAGAWARHRGLGHGAVTLVAETANVGTSGALWIVQYLVLDRLLFVPSGRPTTGVVPRNNPSSAVRRPIPTWRTAYPTYPGVVPLVVSRRGEGPSPDFRVRRRPLIHIQNRPKRMTDASPKAKE